MFIFGALYDSSIFAISKSWGALKLTQRQLLILVAVLAISACHRAPAGTTGQVAATVDGREITVRQLSAELNGAPPAPAAAQKLQQRAALNFIIQRTILADAARKQGLDKDPNFILLNERASDALLVQQLQAKIAANVPPPSPEEVAQFEVLIRTFSPSAKFSMPSDSLCQACGSKFL